MLSSIVLSFLLNLSTAFRLQATATRHVVKATVTVPEDYRRVEVVIDDGQDYRRSSEFSVDSGRMTYWVEWRDVPSGEYVVGVTAMKLDGRLAQWPVVNLLVR